MHPQPSPPRRLLAAFVIISTAIRAALSPGLASAADCNRNGVEDAQDILRGDARDCDFDGFLDECVVAAEGDCNANGVPDACDVSYGWSPDCDLSASPDECDIALGSADDCDEDGIPDECRGDCDGNGIPDPCDLAADPALDCDGDQFLDSCALASRLELVRAADLSIPERIADLARADLDGDELLDLVAAGKAGGVHWLRGQGNGTFDRFLAREGGLPIAAMDIVDLDADGRPDAALAAGEPAGPKEVVVLMNAGPGRLDLRWRVPLEDDPESMASGDLDADGMADLAVGVSRGGEEGAAVVLLGRGGGAFAAPESHAVGPVPARMAAADLDGDADLDLVAATSGVPGAAASTITLLFNHGRGRAFRRADLPVPAMPAGIVVADLDRDLDADIAGVSAGPSVATVLWWVEGRGGGAFGEWRSLARARRGSTVDLTAADLDADGSPDLVLAAGDLDLVEVFTRFEAGTFREVSAWGTGADPRAAVAGDWDGDQYLDLAAGVGRPERVTVLRGDRRQRFRAPVALPTGGGVASGAAGDFDGDGILDAAVADDRLGEAAVHRNDGMGRFTPGPPLGLATGGIDSAVAADLTGDGKDDLVLGNSALERVLIVRAEDGGALAKAGMINVADPVSRHVTPGPLALIARDLDADGLVDIAVGNSASQQVRLYFSGGAAVLADPIVFRVRSPGAFWLSLAAGDFNRDGLVDLAGPFPTEDDLHAFFILWNQGSRSFRFEAQPAAGPLFGPVLAQDIDGDGALDLFFLRAFLPVGHDATLDLIVFRNDGRGRFAYRGRLPIGYGRPGSLASGDFDGDGANDLAFTLPAGSPGEARSRIDAELWIVPGEPGAALEALRTAPMRFDLGAAGSVGGTGDWTGDGRTDLLLLGRGARILANERLTAPDGDADGILDACEDPAGLLAVIIEARAVDGGASLEARATLKAAARPGGAVVHLGTDTPEVLLVPPAVEVAAGTKEAGFVIETRPVARPTAAGVTASLGGVRRAARLTVVPVEFRRGDVDQDLAVSLTDARTLLAHLFTGGAAPACRKSADADDDGKLVLTDAIAILLHLFQGARPLPQPFESCGPDPTADRLACASFDACR